MVYDRSDRLILSQDGAQRASNKYKWTFYIYDNLGRNVLQGEKVIEGLTQKNLKDQLWNSLVIASASSTGSGTYRYGEVKINSLNILESDVLTVNYYDNDSWNTEDSLKSVTLSGYDAPYASAKGRLTGTISVAINSATPFKEKKSCYYDFKGNIVQAHSLNYKSGYDHEYFKYNFTGQPLNHLTLHKVPNKAAIREEYTYKYDPALRMISKLYSLNGASPIAMANYSYNGLGQLKGKTIAGKEASTYQYNVRGWLTQQDSPNFSQDLTYLGDWYNFNGNIISMSWNAGKRGSLGYNFIYDKQNQLRAANSFVSGRPSSENGRYNESVTYDKHGNIQSLKRGGQLATESYGLIDDLTFNYTGNQLTSIREDSYNTNLEGLMEYKKGASSGYTYDVNGRLKSDLAKNISSIEYNSINLPRRITQGSNIVDYVYDASGVKLETKHKKESADPVIRTYLGNKVYENDTLKMILTEEGYVASEGGQYKHYYYLKDHLGNNRVVIDESGNPVQVTDFYPFGAHYASSTNQEKQLYKFGGKELDKMYDLNTYDFSARTYDPVIGRFSTMDPLAEKYYSISPYAYCANNPVRYNDPTGRDLEDKVAGWFIGAVTNAVPFSSTARDWYTPTDADDYNSGLQGADIAAGVVGAALLIDGGSNIAAGTAAEMVGVGITVGTGGTGIEVGGTVAQGGQAAKAIGTTKVIGGSALLFNVASNAKGGYDRGANKDSNVAKPTTQTSAGHKADEYGNKLGPSGKPQVNKVKHSTMKEAKEAARNQGKGSPEKHPSPTKGNKHYHPTDQQKEKIPNSTHHEY